MNDVRMLTDAEIDARIRQGLHDFEIIEGPVFHGRRIPVHALLPPDVEAPPPAARATPDDLDGARGVVNTLLLSLAFGLGACVAVIIVLVLHR